MRQKNQRCQLPNSVFRSNYGFILLSFRDMTSTRQTTDNDGNHQVSGRFLRPAKKVTTANTTGGLKISSD